MTGRVGGTGDGDPGAARDPGAGPGLAALRRHFDALRADGAAASWTTGDATAAYQRAVREAAYRRAVRLLDPGVRAVLAELSDALFRGAGTVAARPVRRCVLGSLHAEWTLGWPEQAAADTEPVTLIAYFGARQPLPVLCAGTVGDWPLVVRDAAEAAEALPTIRAIAASDLINLAQHAGPGGSRLVPGGGTGCGC